LWRVSETELMATCPRCKGHLTDSHQCPRRPLIVAAEITAAAVAGAVVGLLLISLFDQHGQGTDVEYGVSIGAGALLAIGIHRMIRG
jgi:zinc transporter ZupT